MNRFCDHRLLSWGAAAVWLIILFAGCGQSGQSEVRQSNETSKMQYLADTDAYRKVVSERSELLVLDFYADWCKYCKELDPILKEASNQYAGKVLFYKIDIDRNNALARSMGMRSVPYVVLIKNRAVVKSFHGLYPKKAYIQAIENLM